MRILSGTAAALLLVTAACGGKSAPPVDPMAPAYVEVQNQGFLDMTVYALRSGQRIRLGQVSGNSTATFELPRTVVNPGLPIRFQADPIGGNRTPFSQEISVSPGDTVVLRIPPN
ncbi:MAG TPA: hypothetical protein VJU15_02005 [Gemmatimonadales bacterium]|nr:hypothetical protein [Gemmatimonadales bacterium]